MQPAFHDLDYQQYWQKAMDYATYYANAEQIAQSEPLSGYAQYIPLNFQRMKRIGKTIQLLPALLDRLAALPAPLYWLVISEPWCGDAAQIVPVLQAIAAASGGKIQMRIVLRDENLPLMDAHLTGTSRSIPKLIQLDTQFQLLGTWGARPAAAQVLINDLRDKGLEFAAIAETLHKWYADNKQQDIQQEVMAVLPASHV